MERESKIQISTPAGVLTEVRVYLPSSLKNILRKTQTAKLQQTQQVETVINKTPKTAACVTVARGSTC
jgi:hypothetical protein